MKTRIDSQPCLMLPYCAHSQRRNRARKCRREGGTWKQRFLRRRALACVEKVAGPLEPVDESIAGCLRRRGKLGLTASNSWSSSPGFIAFGFLFLGRLPPILRHAASVVRPFEGWWPCVCSHPGVIRWKYEGASVNLEKKVVGFCSSTSHTTVLYCRQIRLKQLRKDPLGTGVRGSHS